MCVVHGRQMMGRTSIDEGWVDDCMVTRSFRGYLIGRDLDGGALRHDIPKNLWVPFRSKSDLPGSSSRKGPVSGADCLLWQQRAREWQG